MNHRILQGKNVRQGAERADGEDRREGEIQAVQDDCDLLSVLRREDIVEEGGFTST